MIKYNCLAQYREIIESKDLDFCTNEFNIIQDVLKNWSILHKEEFYNKLLIIKDKIVRETNKILNEKKI